MSDEYISAFQNLINQTKEVYGYELPFPLEQYVVTLLANHVDRPNWMPEDSFIETYARIKNSRDAKQLGDECLFLCGVFPDYGRRKGLDIEYYGSIGSTSYIRASQALNMMLFESLSIHFRFLSHVINLTIKPGAPGGIRTPDKTVMSGRP